MKKNWIELVDFCSYDLITSKLAALGLTWACFGSLEEVLGKF